jgi:hypothetical protein
MGIFTHEIVLLDVFFKMRYGTLKVIFRFQRCHPNFSGVIDTAETLDLILIAVSAVSLTPLKL